jgi:NAD-dependent dihydropyrimidine dehydrogenase PreA subunit
MILIINFQLSESFRPLTGTFKQMKHSTATAGMAADDWRDDAFDSNRWRSSDDEDASSASKPSVAQQDDWEDALKSKTDGSFWSAFEPSPDGKTDQEFTSELKADADMQALEDDAEVWLSTLASISAEEVEFNMAEADRADKVRQMQEWGFDDVVIKNTFGVEVDDSLESKDEVAGMKEYRKTMYLEDDDWKKIESHTKVEKDPETGEPIRQQMVYVDEHTCIGCTNCAMIVSGNKTIVHGN